MKQFSNMSTSEVLVTLLTLGFIGPIAVPAVRDAVVTWLLEHGVLAGPGAGVIAIPGLDADLAGRALALLILALVIAALAARMALRVRRTQTNDDDRERRSLR